VAFLEEIKTYLVAQGFAGGTGDPPLFLSDMPPSPDQAVGVISSGGNPPETTMDLQEQRFTVLVRGVTRTYAETEELAQRLYQSLHMASIATGWVYCYATIAGPFFLGLDESKRPMFSLNFRALRRSDVLP
jgi:hypothetical protein